MKQIFFIDLNQKSLHCNSKIEISYLGDASNQAMEIGKQMLKFPLAVRTASEWFGKNRIPLLESLIKRRMKWR